MAIDEADALERDSQLWLLCFFASPVLCELPNICPEGRGFVSAKTTTVQFVKLSWPQSLFLRIALPRMYL